MSPWESRANRMDSLSRLRRSPINPGESRERRAAARRRTQSALTPTVRYESVLKSRDKAYYRNLLRSTLTVSVEDAVELGVRPAGELLAAKRVAYDAIVAEDDD